MDDLSSVKSCIRSLLTANSSVSTIETLEKDYRSLIGTNIPARKFGFRDVEEFLKSISDTCHVRGIGRFAAVTPVVTEKSAHINEMVMRQKPTRPRNARFRPPPQRKYFPSAPVQTYSRAAPVQTYSCPVPVQTYPRPAHIQTFVRSYSSRASYSSHTESDSEYFVHDNFSQPNKNIQVDRDGSAPPNRSLEPVRTVPTQTQKDTSISATTVEKLKPRVINHNNNYNDPAPLNNSVNAKTDVKVDNCLTELRLSQNSGDDQCLEKEKMLRTQQYVAGTLSSSKESRLSSFHSVGDIESLQAGNVYHPRKKDRVIEPEQERSNVPSSVRDNLVKLITKHPDGIWCADLLAEYKKEFRKDLRFSDYGYPSLIHMCRSLKNVFHSVRPDQGDFRLYDIRKPLPKTLLRPTAYVPDSSIKEGETSDAIPNLDWSDFEGHIPDDIVKVDEEVKREFLPGVQVGDILSVTVAEIYDPSKFWITLSDSPLDDLMDEMQIFYGDKENRARYRMPKSLMKVGVFCVQIIYQEYHRALIISDLKENDTLKVYFIDYGSVAVYSTKGMCFLKKEFAELPMQAIRCRLANIVPIYENNPWSLETRTRFRTLAEHKDTQLQITMISHEEQYVYGFLADTTDTNNVVYVNEQLVQEGHARWLDQGQLPQYVLPNYDILVNKNSIHLFPTFIELESGLTPTLNEINLLIPFNVPVNLLYPKYYEQIFNINEERVAANLESHFQKLKRDLRRRTLSKPNFEPVTNTYQTDIDFDVFGDFKEEIQQFHNNFNQKYLSVAKENDEDDQQFCESEEINTQPNEMPPIIEQHEEEWLAQAQDDIKISEELINKLTTISQSNNYTLLEESSTSSEKTIKTAVCNNQDHEPIEPIEDDCFDWCTENILDDIKDLGDIDLDESVSPVRHMLDELNFPSCSEDSNEEEDAKENNTPMLNVKHENQDACLAIGSDESEKTYFDEVVDEKIPATTTVQNDELADNVKTFLLSMINKYPKIMLDAEKYSDSVVITEIVDKELPKSRSSRLNPFLVDDVEENKDRGEDEHGAIKVSSKNPFREFLTTGDKDESTPSTNWERKIDSWIDGSRNQQQLSESAPPFIPSDAPIHPPTVPPYPPPPHGPYPPPAYGPYPPHPMRYPGPQHNYPPYRGPPQNYPPYRQGGYHMTPYGWYPEYPPWSNAGYCPPPPMPHPYHNIPPPPMVQSYTNQGQGQSQRALPQSAQQQQVAVRPPPGFAPKPQGTVGPMAFYGFCMSQADFFERYNDMMRRKGEDGESK